MNQVLGDAGDAVLGGEERGELAPGKSSDGVDRMGEIARDRGLVAEETDPASSEQSGPLAHEHIEADTHLSHWLLY